MPDPSDLLTVAEAAAILRLHPVTVQRLLRRGELPGVRVGRQWRIRRTDLDDRLRGEGPEVEGAVMDSKPE